MALTQFPTLPQPPANTPAAHRVLRGALAPATALTNATAVSEVISLGSTRFLTVRILSAAAGSLTFAFARPVATTDGYALANGELDPSKLTAYGTLAPSAVSVSANTEAVLSVTCNGEWYGILTYTPSASAALTWVDVAAV